jgi:hypothetical protein
MSASHIRSQAREPQMRRLPNADRRLGEHVLRALNRIRKPSTAEEITELVNRELDPGDRPFATNDISAWLRNDHESVLSLYWLGTRPRK